MQKMMVLGVGMIVAGSVSVLASTNTVASGTPGIKNSWHDFSNDSWNTSRHTLCGVCHSMHDTDVNKLIPLWKHETSTASFTPYSSPSLNATVGQPSGATLACLSCHDGVTAVNSYGGRTNGAAVYITGGAVIGTDLQHNHPISFDYDAAAAADSYIRASSTVISGITQGTGTSLNGQTIKQAMLSGGTTMECSSCHDIHRQRGNSYSSGIYTVASSAYGEFCLICHIK
jgi:cytochrome c553